MIVLLPILVTLVSAALAADPVLYDSDAWGAIARVSADSGRAQWDLLPLRLADLIQGATPTVVGANQPRTTCEAPTINAGARDAVSRAEKHIAYQEWAPAGAKSVLDEASAAQLSLPSLTVAVGPGPTVQTLPVIVGAASPAATVIPDALAARSPPVGELPVSAQARAANRQRAGRALVSSGVSLFAVGAMGAVVGWVGVLNQGSAVEGETPEEGRARQVRADAIRPWATRSTFVAGAGVALVVTGFVVRGPAPGAPVATVGAAVSPGQAMVTVRVER